MLQKAAFCVQLRRLASDAKPTQGLVAAEMKKLSQVCVASTCVPLRQGVVFNIIQFPWLQ